MLIGIKRIDGALFPWTEKLLDTLVQLAPLVGDQSTIPDIPPSRIVLEPSTREELEKAVDPFIADSRYHEAIVKSNERITAEGWNQDVRHFEFEFEDEVQSVTFIFLTTVP
jgi:sulfite reductase alpha subunit-like flavoprotein